MFHGVMHPPLRSAELPPATQTQRDELTLTPGEQIQGMSQWINDLARAAPRVANRLAERQSLTIPAQDRDYEDLGSAFTAWTGARKDAILQPPKPEIQPSARMLERAIDRDLDMEAAN